MTAEPADIALLARVLHGDESGLSILLDRHWHTLVRYSLSILGDVDAAEDVVQEVFVRLWEHRETWGLEGSVLGLLFRIARNLSLDERRKRDAQRRVSDKAPLPIRPMSPSDYAQGRDISSAVQAAVESLPQRRRDVFILVRQHGLSYREAADALDLKPQTVANHLSLALTDLREALEPHLRDQLGEVGWQVVAGRIRYAGGAGGP